MSQGQKRHIIQSHAHEENVPGTLFLRPAEGDDTAFGQALFPVPSNDLNDPLLWSKLKKWSILVTCCCYSFISVFVLEGPSPYIELFSDVFEIEASTAANLISYANLAAGFGSYIWVFKPTLYIRRSRSNKIKVPLYMKFGRRPVMLLSQLVVCLSFISIVTTAYIFLVSAWLDRMLCSQRL